MNCKVSVNLAEQPEGGFTVTCEELPELVTEGDSVEEAMENLEDVYAATLELYEEFGRPVSDVVRRADTDVPVDNGQLRFEAMLCEIELRLPARKLRALGCQEQPRQGRGSHRIWLNPLTRGSADATLGLGMFVRLRGIWGLVGGSS